jgi:pimeloyl-ACP methyl ester carboxylesterase
VIDILRARRLDVRSVDLPSAHGAPGADLHVDATVVRAVLDDLDDAVLVGHSYGGAVVTEAGAHPHVRHLVYLAAFALTENEALFAAATDDADTAHLDHTGRPDVGAALRSGSAGTTVVAPEAARELFYNCCPADIAADAISRLGPQAMAGFGQSPSAVAWRDRPSTYAVCTQDNAVHPELQRILARRAGRTVEWPADHSPFLSRPELVADLLTEIAAG